MNVVGVARCLICRQLIEGLTEPDGLIRLSVHGNPRFPVLGGYEACIGSGSAFEPAEVPA